MDDTGDVKLKHDMERIAEKVQSGIQGGYLSELQTVSWGNTKEDNFLELMVYTHFIGEGMKRRAQDNIISFKN